MALHVLDNGICVTCTEQQRGKHSVQDEPREPHSGKWVHGAGGVESAAKHAWGAESIQLGGHQVDLEPVHDPKLKYSDERQIKLTVHAPDGPHTVTLTSDAAYNIASSLHEPHETIGIQKLHVAKGRAGAETEHGTGFVGVRRLGDDEYQVRFGGGDGSSPEKIYTTVVAGRQDLDRLSGALARTAAADTRDIKAGPVRIHGRKDGNWELDLPATSGRPVQLTMSADDVTKVSHELQTALGLINDSEYVDDETGYRPKAHDAGQIVREVNLPTTVLRIEATGSAGKEQLHLQSHAHDWTLNLPESDVQEIVDMLADSPVWHSSEAEGLTRSAQHELRGAGPSATWHPMVNGECTQCDADDLLDEDSAALLHALNELDGPLGDQRAAFDPSKHLRNPKGPGGGRFRSNVDKLKDAITAHRKGEHDGHPFDGFSREQLRRVAKARGIELGRGEDRDSISTKLLANLGGKKGGPKDDGDMTAALKKVGLTPDDVSKEALPTPPVAEVPKAGKKKLDAKYLSLDQKPITTAEDRELHESLAGIFEYHDPKTGFRAVLDRGAADFGDVEVRLNILDKDGNKVGTAARHITDVQPGMEHFTGGAPAGSRIVEHSFFQLERRDPPIQGGGFATRWLAAVEEEYRANGVHSITLHADIDVGGYAWAKMGFDFKNHGDAKFLAEHTLRVKGQLTSDDSAREAARVLMDAVESGATPMPIDFAMLGWAPGKKTWLGKEVMLGSDWQGIKRL